MSDAPLTLENIRSIAGDCKFKDWQFRVDQSNGVPYLQVLFEDTDRISGKTELQRCRKWLLSYHMTPSEVIRTAHMAVRQAMEHEVDEEFRYLGARLFNPHADLQKLALHVPEIGVSLRDETNYVPTHK